MFIKFFKKNAFFTTITGSLIVILILSITNFDVLPFINNHFGNIGRSIVLYITSNNIKYTFNSGVFIFLMNLLIFFVLKTPTFTVNIKNSNMKSDSTELTLASNTNHRSKSFHLEIKANYNVWYWYTICNYILGGLQLKVSYPQWVDINVDDKYWNTSRFVDSSNQNHILIDISNAISKDKMDKYSGETVISTSLITNLNSYDEGYITVSIVSKSTKKIKLLFFHIIKFIFFDLSYKKHRLKASN